MEKTFNGWLNIFKERGQTSFSISKAIKINLNLKSWSFRNLDPLARVFPIAVGEATKAINFISNIKKGTLL